MEVLIKMLKNTKENTYHPIWYMISFFLNDKLNDDVKRYKSKGHRTVGFTDRQDAVNSIKTELTDILSANGYIIHEELDEVDDILWDGEDMPIDIQLRPIGKLIV